MRSFIASLVALLALCAAAFGQDDWTYLGTQIIGTEHDTAIAQGRTLAGLIHLKKTDTTGSSYPYIAYSSDATHTSLAYFNQLDTKHYTAHNYHTHQSKLWGDIFLNGDAATGDYAEGILYGVTGGATGLQAKKGGMVNGFFNMLMIHDHIKEIETGYFFGFNILTPGGLYDSWGTAEFNGTGWDIDGEYWNIVEKPVAQNPIPFTQTSQTKSMDVIRNIAFPIATGDTIYILTNLNPDVFKLFDWGFNWTVPSHKPQVVMPISIHRNIAP